MIMAVGAPPFPLLLTPGFPFSLDATCEYWLSLVHISAVLVGHSPSLCGRFRCPCGDQVQCLRWVLYTFCWWVPLLLFSREEVAFGRWDIKQRSPVSSVLSDTESGSADMDHPAGPVAALPDLTVRMIPLLL